MQNQQAAQIADTVLSTIGKGGSSLGSVLERVHGFTQGDNFRSFARRTVASAVAFVRGREDIRYVAFDADIAEDQLTVSGAVVIFTSKNIVELDFQTSDNIYTAPTTSAKAWKRSEIVEVKLIGVSAPEMTDPDDFVEEWSPNAQMHLLLRQGKTFEITSRESAAADFIKLAGELSE